MHKPFRDYLIQSVFLLVLLIIAFPGFFFRGEVLSPADILFQSKPWKSYAPKDWTGPSNRLMSDVVTAFYPYYSLTKREFDEGRWPLWNRYELGGMPLMANAQTAIFYPPRLVHRFFDIPTANSLYILFKFWLCGMTAFFCARGLRFNINAARFMSVAWMLCGYTVAWAYWSLPDVAAWLPVLFLGTEKVLNGRYVFGGMCVTLSGVMMLFAGHPETAFTMSFGVGVYFALRLAALVSQPRAVARAVIVMGLAWMIALLVASVQVLPLLEYMRHSFTFVQRHREASEPVLVPSSLVALWAPRFYGTGAEQTYWGWEVLNSNVSLMLYVGLPVWAMAWLGGAPLRKSDDRAAYWSLLCASLFCMLLAFGLNELRWINAVPPFGSTVKFYHAAFPVFALIVLGARGLDRWRQLPKGLVSLAPLLGAVAVPVLIIYSVMSFESSVIVMKKAMPVIEHELTIVAAFAVLTVIVCILSCFDRSARVFPQLLVGVLAADLLVTARGMNPTMRKADVYPETRLTKFLQGLPGPCRIGIGEGGVASGTFSPYGIEEWLGYDGLYPARVKTFQNQLGEDVWNAAEPLYANEYYLNDPEYPPVFPLQKLADRFELVGEFDGLQVFKNRSALPRARLVGRLRMFDNDNDMFNAMRRKDFHPEDEVFALVQDVPEGALALQDATSPGSASISEYSSVRVVIDIHAESDAVLVFADAYYPGWRLTIDGVPSPHFPVYHAFRGAIVPKGRHTAVYEYRPRSFQIGLFLSMTTLLVLLGIGGPLAVSHVRVKGQGRWFVSQRVRDRLFPHEDKA